jgi:hypothetical protein
MRPLLFVVGVVLAGCGTALCRPGTCPAGQHCVYVGAETTPSCRPACELGVDAGTCASGTTCGCGGSCAGCENCVPVCQ